MNAIVPIKMPKWGLSMEEGTIVEWLKPQGAIIEEGQELLEIETAKIVNVAEAPGSGVLRRIIAEAGAVVPVGALIGILADADTSEEELDDFANKFEEFSAVNKTEVAPFLQLSTIEADGRVLQIGRAGPDEGTPVVLVHGWAADLKSWQFNLEALAKLLPVYAIDLPGHGGSSKEVGDGSLANLANALGAVLDTLGLQRAHLIGHSLGGAVAARLAADRPEIAETLTLIAPAHMPGGQISDEFLDGVISAGRARSLKPFLQMLVADPASVTREMVEDVLKYKRIDGVDTALSVTRDRLSGDTDRVALQADLAALAQRPGGVLIIASKSDRIVGVPDESALPPGFQVRWIEAAGHLPHLERAGEVNAILIERVCR